jgi:glutamate/tyrosine decarboxylase-like PLP-dependent enzyme
MKELSITNTDPRILKLVAYYPETAHSCMIKATLLKDIPHSRELSLEYDREKKDFVFNVKKFEEIVEKDIADGLIPFFMATTVGATSTCGRDPVDKIGEICQKHKIWLTVDAAYAGGAFICPEFSDWLSGLDKADAILVNFAKWMLGSMSATFFFVGNKTEYIEAMGSKINPTYIKNKFTQEYNVVDYKDWQVGLGKRQNCYKIWYLIRCLGVEGLQENIRVAIKKSEHFRQLVEKSSDFEIVCPHRMALVCFRLKIAGGDDARHEKVNEELNKRLASDTTDGFLVPSKVEKIFYLRFVVCNYSTQISHIDKYWERINTVANGVKEDIAAGKL